MTKMLVRYGQLILKRSHCTLNIKSGKATKNEFHFLFFRSNLFVFHTSLNVHKIFNVFFFFSSSDLPVGVLVKLGLKTLELGLLALFATPAYHSHYFYSL